MYYVLTALFATPTYLSFSNRFCALFVERPGLRGGAGVGFSYYVFTAYAREFVLCQTAALV